ncbi:MAG: hypothetical protein IAF38_20530, partial [Bacteroidia bacterium]|nr:hypothetical protein [Bacteroidia bacterium]
NNYTEELNCSNALNYYLLAAENSEDKEFKAKCTFMAAKCELNASYSKKGLGEDKYFGILQKDFSKTKYYSEILKECSYFRYYVKK